MWIWQEAGWPNFTWQSDVLAPLLREVHFNQGLLLGRMSHQSKDEALNTTLDTLLANIIHSSAIEGEKLNAFSVRSSLANKLGVSESEPYARSEQSDSLADLMLDALPSSTESLKAPLSLNRLLHWHRLLFSGDAGQSYLSNDILVGQLRGESPMQVISYKQRGRIDRPTLHFEAPGRERLEADLTFFIDWFNQSLLDESLDPELRAGITHLWFVTLHPMDDGNGRLTRLLTDLALAQGESQSIRLYAMSVSILENRQSYYDVLESVQKGQLDITDWLVWFLKTLNQSLLNTLADIEQTLSKTRYWQSFDQTQLSKEQSKVLNRLLDGDFELGINSGQYQKVAKVSRATATRHLAHLIELGCLVKTGAGGRSTRYKLNL
ncbi:cell division protein Fic [Marinomonas sp. SBI22]|uniref:Fic family protein n=1 Tax=unclassified Marinomonas TaxID=196814 RepID=UPI0007AF40D4|nr:MULTISPECIES: Fic family protein [unclassified Marinomonas]KZM40593.1 cell division protein Fic [Marinomonas sp. SBI22]KZM42295.1 cell division protein Fic [Marinomonas sp. SBI8L]